MSTLQTAILTRLRADAALTALLPGGLWERPLQQGSGPQATPAAFGPSGPGGVPRLRPCLVLLDPGEVGHPSGDRDRNTQPWDAWARPHLYAPATDAGRALLEQADARLIVLLHDWQTPAHVGLRALPERGPTLPSDEFPGNLVTYRRFRATGVRVITPAA